MIHKLLSLPHPRYLQAHQYSQSAQTTSINKAYRFNQKTKNFSDARRNCAPCFCLAHDGLLASSPADKMLLFLSTVLSYYYCLCYYKYTFSFLALSKFLKSLYHHHHPKRISTKSSLLFCSSQVFTYSSG